MFYDLVKKFEGGIFYFWVSFHLFLENFLRRVLHYTLLMCIFRTKIKLLYWHALLHYFPLCFFLFIFSYFFSCQILSYLLWVEIVDLQNCCKTSSTCFSWNIFLTEINSNIFKSFLNFFLNRRAQTQSLREHSGV